jgi:hypothetical protein
MSAKRIQFFSIMILVIVFLFFALRPTPNTEFLYRNFLELQPYTKNLKGSSTAFFLDPSFFYKFTATEQDLELIVSQLGLEPVPNEQHDYFKEQTFGRNKPMLWHSWWWRPAITSNSLLFSGHRGGNQVYLLYNANVIYLYIQNT